MPNPRTQARDLEWTTTWACWIAVAWSALALLVLAYGVAGGLSSSLLGTRVPYWSFALLVYDLMGFALLTACARAAERRGAWPVRAGHLPAEPGS